uniref:SNF-related serine/threonine-protein kinase n=1 Tax=Phallusia mammillata TaxID=59560 RepID=A0A6F9DTU4_9ASCI|nr:SNF-related serine/threonine-protein kinase-like [Phallusia mammillata]
MWQQSEHRKIAESYELKKTLGRGHFAVVKLAHHVFSGEKVAVKVIDKTKMDRISADHLHHEVTCMKLVQHPNVVRLYQVIETSTKLYLILELGDGGDMFDYIMRHDKGLHEDQAKEYFAQIVSAIAYCHKLHVVHRDLKPENVVFFESQGLVKLTDFGFSNHYRPGEKLSTSCGSLAYSAPEILLGEEYDAPAVDVWSLGVILYMLVCGVAPFNEANDSETLINIMDCRYTVLDHVSEQCEDLIKRMIIREPSHRMSLDDIVNHPWLTGAKSLSRARRNSVPMLTRNNIPADVHREILEIMVNAELADEDEILTALTEDRYDHITSTYFLLAERSIVQQTNSKENQSSDEEDLSDDNETSGRFQTSDSRPVTNRLRPMYPDAHSSTMQPVALSVSPPCNQATLIPSASVSVPADPARRRTRSSSSEDSNSSLSTSLERRSNPSYIREHLTITPRHGFSVAHGGIDTLIEEEERSRSQTTTDDEADAADDIANMVNPKLLASQLQRTLQLKRFKKRKSAPVLNEICEETELENDISEIGDGMSRTVGQHHTGRHSISSSSPTSHSGHHYNTHHQSGGSGVVFDHQKETAHYSVRPGRAMRRRKSQKCSSSETSDDDSESRRTSSTNLSSTVGRMMLQRRRDSSDDKDDDHTGGGPGPGNFLPGVNEQITTDCQDSTAAAEEEKENPKSSDDASAAGNTRTHVMNNVSQHRSVGKKPLCLNDSNHKINNIFGVRSKSAESHTSSSYSMFTSSRSSSSARSSCSSLSSNHRLRTLAKRNGRLSMKNSSSTRSDTGLVLRYHKNNVLVKCKCKNLSQTSRSSSSSSLVICDNLRVSNSLNCVSPPGLTHDNGVDSDSGLSSSRHHRSCSLPRHSKRLNHPNFKKSGQDEDQSMYQTLFSESNDEISCVGAGLESLTVKRSNLSLASSTCSGSKFVVDPVNELAPSPALTPLSENRAQTLSFNFSDHSINLPAKTKITKPELNNLETTLSMSASLEEPGFKKHQNILTKLNNLKPNARHSSSLDSGSVLGSGQLKVEHKIVRKVKARNCCSLM